MGRQKGEAMSAPEDFDAVKTQIAELQTALEGVSEEDWQTYTRVRDILGTTTGGLQLVNEGAEAAASAAGGTVSHFTFVHKCAMLGLFEPGLESGTSGAYDPVAVQRFADLGG
jgi:hypothetical protein